MRASLPSLLWCASAAVASGLGLVPASAASADASFERSSSDFVSGYYAFRPLDGVAVGWHQYDGQFVVPQRAALEAEAARLKQFDQTFAAINPKDLSPDHRRDLAVLQSVIIGQRWMFDVQRPAWRNPMFYAGALDVSVYLKRDFKPLAERVQDITRILRQASPVFAAARANLEPVLPRPFVETAIEVAEGTAKFIETDVAKAAAGLDDAPTRQDFAETSRAAARELRSFVEWLRKEKVPKANDSFALGVDGYRTMLQAELVDLSSEQILAIGLRELKAEQDRFAAAAALIDPSQPAIDVYRSIQKEHPTAEALISETARNLETIRSFVVDRRIVTIPSEVRARVQETLPPFRATSFASMDTPGPFERKATEAYYYVTPVESDWSAKQAEEWLTAFNYYTTDVVSIHEAYPGHYLQFLALNASSASTVRKLFYSYPFVEGWAHYTEQMMIEQGFGLPANPVAATRDQLIKAAKYRLAQSDEALLRLCRLCCSVKLHTQGMTVDQATRFFTENCYYEEKPARQEALRGTFDPGYLYYTLGKLMILKLRADWQAQEGDAFSLQRFHDAFLSFGAPPIGLVRQWMLRDPSQWPASL